MHRRFLRIVALTGSLAIVTSACSGGSGSPSAKPATQAPATATAAAPAGTPVMTQPPAATPTAAAATPSSAPATPATSEPAASATPEVTPAPTPVIVAPESIPPGATVLRWYCCLGTGDDPSQVAIEKKVIDDFNAAHEDIKVVGEFVIYAQAYDQLATEIAAGNAPDIVGPVGFGGANAFADRWLDLGPLIQKNNYDLSQFESSTVDFFKVGNTQVGIPFAIFPSELYYQRGMFEEIGLSEPPHKYGEKYTVTGQVGAAAFGVAEGTQVDWNYDTVAVLAKLLTVDENNVDATQAGFDPTKISQYGFEPQRDDLRGLGAFWGPGSLAAADGKTVQIPAAWAAAWKAFYNGIWTDHAIADGSKYNDQTVWNPDGVPFCNGKVAMAENFLWSTYCLAGAGDNWDIAVIPAHTGTQTAAFNADTFRIMKSTKNQDAAFTFLRYLLDDASGDLTQIYGALPAREDGRQAFFDTLTEGFMGPDAEPKLLKAPDWQVAIDGIEHADIPNFEEPIPAYNESVATLVTYRSRWDSTPGLDMDQQLEALRAELQGIWDR
jgi:multiple sugar transport system substrate-binding protein